jgi:hypothetical protein
VRSFHAGDDWGHHAGTEIHFSENPVAVARGVGAARLKSVAGHRVDRVPVRVDYKNRPGRSGRKDRVIDCDLGSGTITQVKTKGRLVL